MRIHPYSIFIGSIFVLFNLFIITFAYSDEGKATYWRTQWKGANFFNRTPKEDWFVAAKEAGIQSARLASDKWQSEGSDFLIGDADSFEQAAQAQSRSFRGELVELYDKKGREAVPALTEENLLRFDREVLQCRAKEDVWQEEVSYHPEYVHPVDGAIVPCPLVSLQGTILQHTFPGVPNYESIEDGDAPETRWVLVIPESEIQRLNRAGFIPQEDIFTSEARGWVQLIAPHSESDPIPFLQQQVVVEGYLGTLIFHVHTPITIEAIRIYDDE